jgi:hypothetical protein
VAEVGEDIPLVDSDSDSREEAAVLGLRDERTNDRDAGRVGGDGVVDGAVREEAHRWTAHVMGGASDGLSSRAGIGRKRPNGRKGSYRKPDRPCVHSDARRRSQEDGRGGSLWRWWERPVQRSAARAQVAVRTRASALRPYDWAGEAGGERSGPVGDWGGRDPKEGGV